VYGGGWVEGSVVEIINRRVWLVDPDEDGEGGVCDRTPKQHVGRKATIKEIFDDRYDSPEQVGSIWFKLTDNGTGEEFQIASYFCREVIDAL
jgi:hypothetical protein